MNDDPTQLFPESLWKRYATEPVSVPARHRGRILTVSGVKPEVKVPARSIPIVKTLVKMPTQPLLS